VDREGFAPSFPACEAGVFLLDEQPNKWTRMDSNHRFLVVSQESSPLDHGTIAVAEVGIEPTIPH
jgi:hypothetical protein